MADHIFKFALLESKPPRTVRKIHIRRLYDILHLCMQRGDFVRARRAWSILIRCKEIDWKPMWMTAVHLLGNNGAEFANNSAEKVELLRAIMLQHPEEVNFGLLTLEPSVGSTLFDPARGRV
jgi:RNA polymerase I-specific transcription initiation factor RRN11